MLIAIIYCNTFGLFKSVYVERMMDCVGKSEGVNEGMSEGVSEDDSEGVNEGDSEIGVCVYSVGSEVSGVNNNLST